MTIDREVMKTFIKERGWHDWYSPEYWVASHTVENPSQQDYTNYGMTIELAYRFETEAWPKFQPFGLPVLSMAFHASEIKGRK